MAGKHGGARPGAGRKKKAEKFAGPVAEAEARIADRLPALVENMQTLAGGGFECVEEEWARDTGAADDAADPPLILVRRKVSHALPDRQANQYLIDRVLGRPTQKNETDVTSKGEAVRTVFYLPANGRDANPD